ncbi:hypothetical protein [Streptomyces noursei]|uniref:hypothetical protein n=1 Tax=Streptomyces noursei TaxID=1971 RepID=UPI0037DA1A30
MRRGRGAQRRCRHGPAGGATRLGAERRGRDRGRGLRRLGRAVRPVAGAAARDRDGRRRGRADGTARRGAAAGRDAPAGRVGAGPRHPRVPAGPLGGGPGHRPPQRRRGAGRRTARPRGRRPRGRRRPPARRRRPGHRQDRTAAVARRVAGRRGPPGPAVAGAGGRRRHRARRRPAGLYGTAARHDAPGRLGPGADAGVRPGPVLRAEAARRNTGRHPLLRVAHQAPPGPRIVAPRRSAESTATHGAATANAPAPHTANATGPNPSGPSNTTGIAGTASTSATTSASGARPATASASAAAPHQHATSTPPTSFTPSNESSEQFTLRNRCRNEEEGGGTTAGPADPSRTGTLRLRTRTEAPEPGPAASQAPAQGPAHTSAPMPRLFILVDDFDALVSPALGSTGRPAAGSVVRALEAVARDGVALGVHLIAATGHPDRTEGTTTAERAALRIQLGRIPSAAGRAGPAEPAPSDAEPVPPGRGWLYRAEDGASTPFQAGRVTGRIPRTSTLRPTVVPLEWQRMGDPPARRPLRELGNGPTDLALLASALQRAAQSSGAPAGPSLM